MKPMGQFFKEASITAVTPGCRRRASRIASGFVGTVRKVVALVAGSNQQNTLLNLPRSMARMSGVAIIACSGVRDGVLFKDNPRHASILSAEEDRG